MAAHDRAGRCGRGQGGRFHGLRCDTGQSRRENHAGPGARRGRRITTVRIVRLIIEEHLPAGTYRNTLARTEATASKPGAITWWPGCETVSTALDSSDDCARRLLDSQPAISSSEMVAPARNTRWAGFTLIEALLYGSTQPLDSARLARK